MVMHKELISINTGVLSVRRVVFACCALGIVLFPETSWTANISIGSSIRVSPSVKTMKDMRDEGLVKQQFDYSCGAAALATILRYGFGNKVTEKQILLQLFDLLTDDEKKSSRKKGFSLFDLQRVAQARGYKAQGFRLKAQDLPRLDGPVIVFIDPRDYKHFAVLRGVRGDRVYLADPSRGNIRQSAHVFLKSWLQEDGKGIIFVVEPKTGTPSRITPLIPFNKGLPQPEIMAAREMLAVGNPFLRLPELIR